MTPVVGTLPPVSSTTRRSTGTPASVWVSAVSHLDPKYGGLSAAVPALASAVTGSGRYRVSLAGFCSPGEHFAPAVSERVTLNYLPLGYGGWLRDSAARETFRRLVAHSAGVHIHGLWQMSTSVAARAARAHRKPYVVSAHGMLESWALANKKLKKSLYAALFERTNLRGAACLHALTEAEAEDYRRFGLSNPIAVIPNGVTIPEANHPGLLLGRYPELRDKRLVLFLGRIHYKKGLDILSDAWGRIARDWSDAHLVLAGPDSEGTRAKIEERLTTLGVRNRVTFTGMLAGDLKWSALAAAECFVLPSYSEGLSVSVLEAMGMGVPVIITRQCNLPEVAAHGCGWTIEPRVDELETALAAALGTRDADRRAIGQTGRRLVAERFCWSAIGAQMAALYEWLGGGAKPSGLILHDEAVRA